MRAFYPIRVVNFEQNMPSATLDCDVCGGTGWRSSGQGQVKGAVVPCECRERSRAERIIEVAGIPRRYENCDFNNFNCAWKGAKNLSLWAALGATQKFADDYIPGNPGGLLFLGPPGVGKTHLLVALLTEVLRPRRQLAVPRLSGLAAAHPGRLQPVRTHHRIRIVAAGAHHRNRRHRRSWEQSHFRLGGRHGYLRGEPPLQSKSPDAVFGEPQRRTHERHGGQAHHASYI